LALPNGLRYYLPSPKSLILTSFLVLCIETFPLISEDCNPKSIKILEIVKKVYKLKNGKIPLLHPLVRSMA